MLKKAQQTVRAVAEQAGILPPNVADAQAAAEQHRQSLVAAQSTLEKSEQELQAAHDRSAEDAEILRLEAALAAAKADAKRAQDRYRGAETRLAKALAAESAGKTAAAREMLDEALTIRIDTAKLMDELAEEMAKLVHLIDSQDEAIALAMREGVTATYPGPVLKHGRLAAECALSKHGAIPRPWIGDPAQQPGAADLIAKDNGALVPMQAAA